MTNVISMVFVVCVVAFFIIKQTMKPSPDNYEKSLLSIYERLNNLEKSLKTNNRLTQSEPLNSNTNELAEIQKNMKIFDLNKQSTNSYDCVKSKDIIVTTTICIHDVKSKMNSISKY